MTKRDVRQVRVLRPFLQLLAPFAPHAAEELWQRLAGDSWTGSLTYEPWPAYDAALARESQIEVAVQINGKVRTRVTVPADVDAKGLEAAALADEKGQGAHGRQEGPQGDRRAGPVGEHRDRPDEHARQPRQYPGGPSAGAGGPLSVDSQGDNFRRDADGTWGSCAQHKRGMSCKVLRPAGGAFLSIRQPDRLK